MDKKCLYSLIDANYNFTQGLAISEQNGVSLFFYDFEAHKFRNNIKPEGIDQAIISDDCFKKYHAGIDKSGVMHFFVDGYLEFELKIKFTSKDYSDTFNLENLINKLKNELLDYPEHYERLKPFIEDLEISNEYIHLERATKTGFF